MIRMMRCTVPHWRGEVYVDQGTLLAEGDANVIPAFYALVEYADPVAPKSKRGG